MTTPTCRTCRFRVTARSGWVCSAFDTWRTAGFPQRHQDAVSGSWVTTYPEGWGALRPTCAEARAEVGPCGPGARAYRPRLRTRLWRWLTRKGGPS